MYDDQPGHPDPARSPQPQPGAAPGPATGHNPSYDAATMSPAAPAGQPAAAGDPYASADPYAAGDPAAPAERGQTHSEFYRLPSNRWWKGVITILALLVTMFVASFAFTLIAGIIDMATGQLDIEAAVSYTHLTLPTILLV